MQRLFPLVICWLICRRGQTKDYVIAQTVDLFRQNFKSPERLKHLRTLDDERANSLYSLSVPIAFPQRQKSLSSVLPKRVYLFSMRMHSKSTQRKLENHKKTSRGEVSRRSVATITKRNNLEAKKKPSVVRKRIATNSSHYTSVINHLSWYGAVCSCPS